MKCQKTHKFSKRCRGTTLPELLIIIILSGILFLLLFEGMNIINKYNRVLRNRLIAKNDLFYSHSTLESIMEDTDSIRKAEEDLLLFYRTGEIKYTLLPKQEGFQVLYKELQDTIFINNVYWKLHFIDEKKNEIDSIFVTSIVDNDSLTLKYGLSSINIH